MENPSSPLDTLRQLKEMLDAGALTPSEFEALKQRLVLTGLTTTPPPPPAAAEPAAPAPVPSPPTVVSPHPPAAASPPPEPSRFPLVENVPLHSTLSGNTAPPAPAPEVRAPEPERASPAPRLIAASFPPPPAPPRPASAREPLAAADASWVSNEFPESEAPAPRSPLALILSIGGLLALLGLVVYLSLNKHPSEHISSTSQTAADSMAAPAMETGPQAEPLARQSAAVPETVRVRPTNPAPPVQRRFAAPVRDSSVVVRPAATAPAAADSTTNP